MIRMSPLHQQSITPAGKVLWIFFLQSVSLALSWVNYDSELVGSWCGKQGMLLCVNRYFSLKPLLPEAIGHLLPLDPFIYYCQRRPVPRDPAVSISWENSYNNPMGNFWKAPWVFF